MQTPFRTIRNLCLELAGLAVAAGLVILVAGLHYFDGTRANSAGAAMLFALVSLTVAVGLILGYAVLRVARLKLENGHLHDAATRDGLTRLLNRAAFKRQAEAVIAQAGRRRGDDQDLTLLIVDADHFKRINDRLGHQVGDQALVAIATALTGSLRHDDFVGRLGGEEFVILLRGAGFDDAHIVAERLRAVISRLAVGSKAQPHPLSVSLGGVSFNRPIAFDVLYKIADANLYKAKRNGRNRAELSEIAGISPVGRHPQLHTVRWQDPRNARASAR